jgi:Tol biopolymer transport system component
MVIKPLAAGLLLLALIAAAPAQASRIAFVRDADLYSMRPDGSDVRQLTSLGAERSALFQNWSPDARALAFDVISPDAPTRVWTMNADGGGLRMLLDDPGYNDWVPSYAPDGRHIVFSRCPLDERFGCGIYRVRTDGTHLEAITRIQLEISDWAPAYSPDGRRLAFGSFARGGVLATTYVADADGSHIKPVGPPELQLFPGEWAPDGSRLALYSNCCHPENSNVFTERPSGKARRNLTRDPDINDVLPTWSPDGERIAFERDAPDFSDSDVYVMRADGSHPTLIQHSARMPRWAR